MHSKWSTTFFDTFYKRTFIFLLNPQIKTFEFCKIETNKNLLYFTEKFNLINNKIIHHISQKDQKTKAFVLKHLESAFGQIFTFSPYGANDRTNSFSFGDTDTIKYFSNNLHNLIKCTRRARKASSLIKHSTQIAVSRLRPCRTCT